MRKMLMLVAALLVFSASAYAATLTLPSVTFTQLPAATGITCNEVPAANLVIPNGGNLPAGTVIFNCTVAPGNWTGAVSLAGGNPDGVFAVSGLSGNTFNVALAQPVSAPATDAPGTLTAIP